MKGLLIKDFCLLKGQVKFMVTVVILAIGIAFLNRDASFILGYMAVVIPLFVLSTVSYDEFDNGNAFLFTLPISRSIYVWEKYCFAGLLGLAALALALPLCFAVGAIQGAWEPMQWLLAAPLIFGCMLLLLSFMIPLQIKFGAEKGRIALLIVAGIVCAGVFAIGKLLETQQLDLNTVLSRMQRIPIGVLITAAILITALVILLSATVSNRILQNKEF